MSATMTNESDGVRTEPLFYVRHGLGGIEIVAVIDGAEVRKSLSRGAAWNIALTLLGLLRETEK